MVWMENCL